MRCLRYTSRGMIAPAIPTQTDRSGCWIIIGTYGATFRPWVMLVPADESPRRIAECREGRGFSPATENGS
jgi:hypothetical protein